jgi:hypothetical protein
VAELADAPDLGSGGEIRRGSSPLPGISMQSAMQSATRNRWRFLKGKNTVRWLVMSVLCPTGLFEARHIVN